MTAQGPKKKQHYLPCCYLQFFAKKPKGRKSRIHLFDGKRSIDVDVESQGYKKYTYSEKDPESAEYFFRYNFEDGYPIIAKKITTGKMLTSEERKDLLIFALVTRFRSPSYVIRTGEERIDAFEHIMGSACNEIEAIRPEDWLPQNVHNHLTRIHEKYSLQLLKLPIRIFISENPVIIYMHNDVFGVMILMPISPEHMAVFYQQEHLSCKETVTKKDVEHLLISQRQSRIKNLYYPIDLTKACRPDKELPAPAENLSEVTAGKVVGASGFRVGQMGAFSDSR